MKSVNFIVCIIGSLLFSKYQKIENDSVKFNIQLKSQLEQILLKDKELEN